MISLEQRLAAFVGSEPLLAGAAALARDCRCRLLLVGGAIRDLALGRPIGDLDFILEGPSRPFLARLSRMLGHRVVTFSKRGIVDHRIRAGDREWDIVACGARTRRGEILRRDFSLNAVAFDPVADRIYDPAGGRDDLARRRVHALSDGVFRDDPLRMLRAVRLWAEIPGLVIERPTAELIRRDARLLQRISPERIKAELDRILASPRPSRAVHRLERLGLLSKVLPELDPLRGLEQNRYHHLDGFAHTLAALAAADDLRALARGLPKLVFLTDPSPPRDDSSTPALDPARARLLRWSLLLHDTGKAETRTLGPDGEYHFYLHERASARIARSVLRGLRASRVEIASTDKLIALHLRLSIPATGEVTPRALRRIVRDAGCLTPLLVLHSLADKIASRGPSHVKTLARLRRASRALLETWRQEVERQRRLPRLVNGRDVMQVLGLPPGPAVGILLAEIEDLQHAGELEAREDALRWLLERGPPDHENASGSKSREEE